MRTEQFLVTPAAGKRLIARAIVQREDIQEALKNRTIVVIAGTTNLYIANELLKQLGSSLRAEGLSFHRGVLNAPGSGRIDAPFAGDLVITKGKPEFRTDLADVCSSLSSGDIILKGANAVDLTSGRAAVLIGNMDSGGTIIQVSRAVITRRVRVILPVGVEKRVEGPIDELVNACNDSGSAGLRMFPAFGEVYTELSAIRQLTGGKPLLLAGGAVNGGEGSVLLGVQDADTAPLHALMKEISKEPPCVI